MQAQMVIVRDIIYGAIGHGADFRTMCEELGIEPAALAESEKMVPFELGAGVWDVATRQTGDPLLALHMGEQLNPSILGMIGYLMQNSQTLLDSIVMLSKYNALYSTMFKFIVEESGSEVKISYEPAVLWRHTKPESGRQAVEMAMAGTLKLFELLSGKKVWPVKVTQAYESRAVKEYTRIFQLHVQFKSKSNTITFLRSHMQLPVLSYDKSLFAFFNETLEKKLRFLEDNDRLSEKIKLIVLHDFKGNAPSVGVVAAQLNMTTRSLQRRLREENTSYRQVAGDMKRELAKEIMKHDGYRVSEVANVLGYSDSSALRKALTRWENG